ncbi:MAG: beta-lactamase domain protein [Gemmatimonadetes bacterium]|nr:beta-lactamase domain protein [Gemmatimonadota bacterium]
MPPLPPGRSSMTSGRSTSISRARPGRWRLPGHRGAGTHPGGDGPRLDAPRAPAGCRRHGGTVRGHPAACGHPHPSGPRRRRGHPDAAAARRAAVRPPPGRPPHDRAGQAPRKRRRIHGSDMERLWGRLDAVPAHRVVTLAEGDVIDCGSRALRVMHTPGHVTRHVADAPPPSPATSPASGWGAAATSAPPPRPPMSMWTAGTTAPTACAPWTSRPSTSRTSAAGPTCRPTWIRRRATWTPRSTGAPSASPPAPIRPPSPASCASSTRAT